MHCGEGHLTKDCGNSSKPAVCCNCGGNHSANYAGCKVHKNLTSSKNNNVPATLQSKNVAPKQQQTQPARKVDKSTTFAKAATSKQHPAQAAREARAKASHEARKGIEERAGRPGPAPKAPAHNTPAATSETEQLRKEVAELKQQVANLTTLLTTLCAHVTPHNG